MALPIQIALTVLFLLTGCTKSEGPAATPTGNKILRLYTWSEYFPPAFIEAFEKETGATVKVDYFASNEQMLTKLQLSQGEAGYDLILPSDYMVRPLVELKLLQPIDKSALPFLADFEAEGLNPPYDQGLTYAVPLAVGTTGIAWNSKLLPKLPENFTWKQFFELPAGKGKVTLLDDMKESLQAALLSRGKDLGTATEADVTAAFAYLKSRKSQLKGFTTETRPVVEGDECVLCMAYSGDVLSVAKGKPEIKYILPADGATIWTDNFAIPLNATNPTLAHKFIARVLSAEGAKEFTERTGYRTFNKKAKALLPKAITESRVVYPQADAKQLHYLVERKDLNTLIDKEWARLKSE